MNPLDPIRHAYGEAEGAPPVPGTPEHAEYRLLEGTRTVLDRMPKARPDASALDAVKAAVAARAQGPLLAAYGEAEPPADARRAEYALLRSTREVLDGLPKARPDAATLDAVTAAAREAAALVPLRHALGEAEGAPPALGTPGHAEYALLAGTLAALGALPRQRPDASTLDAIRAAAEARTLQPVLAAYGEAEPPVDAARRAEYALLRSTRQVLDRTPKARPDATVLAAITAAAAGVKGTAVPLSPVRPAVPRPVAPVGPRPAADRPAEQRGRRFGPLPTWIGTAAMLVVIATVGIWMLNEQPEPVAEQTEAPLADEQADADALMEGPIASAPEGSGLAVVPEAEQASPPTVAPDAGVRVVPAPAEAQRAAALSPRRIEPAPPPPPRAALPAAPSAVLPSEPARENIARAAGRDADGERAALSAAGSEAAAWEAGEDVRLLSLRLQHIAETSEGLAWDEPPAPFGAAGDAAGARLEGVQTVGDDLTPAHIEVRMRTAPSDRSDDQ